MQLRKAVKGNYVTADISDPRATVRVDITDIPYNSDTFDAVICSHVLEHVLGDRRAMREVYRVLKPGAWAIMMVPVTVEKTFEDPTAVTPEDRLRLFGQRDHVRRYGPDFVERLRDTGFEVGAFTGSDFLSERGVKRTAVRQLQLFHCTKPDADLSSRGI